MSPATPTLVPMATPPAAPTMMSAVPAMSASPGAVSLQVSDPSGCVNSGIQQTAYCKLHIANCILQTAYFESNYTIYAKKRQRFGRKEVDLLWLDQYQFIPFTIGGC